MLNASHYAILSSETDCYRCHLRTHVVGLALGPDARYDDEDPYEHGWLNAIDVAHLPPPVAARLQRLLGGCNYKVDFSATAGHRYVLNHCAHCGAKLGDHFMHGEPGGPFFGDETEDLNVQFVNEPISLDSAYAEGPLGDWIVDQLA